MNNFAQPKLELAGERGGPSALPAQNQSKNVQTNAVHGRLRRFAVHRLTEVEAKVQPESPADYNLSYQAVTFRSRDGLQLKGWLVPAPDSKATVIIAHGYTRNKTDGLLYGWWLWQAGYSLFMFDFRGHGQSESSHGTSIGYMERLDILGAVDYLVGRGEQSIALFGISMGASSSILAAVESPYVKAVVADSPYAYLYRSIATQVSKFYKAPRWLAKPIAKFALGAVADYHGYQAAQSHPIDYVSRLAPRPLLLIHGQADTLTEAENSQLLYRLAAEPKQIWLEPGVEHAQMYRVRPHEYRLRVVEFLNKVNWVAPQTLLDGQI